jgi:hypothetical protein
MVRDMPPLRHFAGREPIGGALQLSRKDLIVGAMDMILALPRDKSTTANCENNSGGPAKSAASAGVVLPPKPKSALPPTTAWIVGAWFGKVSKARERTSIQEMTVA